MDPSEFAKTVISLFAIVNPIGAVPAFLAIASGATDREKRRMAAVASVAVLLLLVGAVFVGGHILRFFGISMASFRVAGGLLLLLMAIAMLHARSGIPFGLPDAATGEFDEDKTGIAVVPVAMPLLAGPGSISTTVLYAHQCRSWTDRLLLVLATLVVAVAVWLCLRLAGMIGRRLGRTGVRIFTRLMGLFLAAIAVEFMVKGLLELLPGLA